jgi:hypothetical protein
MKESMGARLAKLEAQIAALTEERAKQPPELPVPSPADLRAEIETGPLAAELAPFWADVFGPHKTKRKELKWREGKLKPDAAEAIKVALTTLGPDGRSRCDELGWSTGWTHKLVAQAKAADRRA